VNLDSETISKYTTEALHDLLGSDVTEETWFRIDAELTRREDEIKRLAFLQASEFARANTESEEIVGARLKVTSHDNRGSRHVPYGFVYFSDGKRCVFSGHYDGSEADRLKEGVSNGTGGWEAVTEAHLILARQYLKEQLGEHWYEQGQA
jgi:hypothetical protein